MSNKATRPDYFSGFKGSLTSEAELKDKGIDLQDQAIAGLANNKGWKILREYIESMITDLDVITKVQMSEGKDFEEIGRNAVVTQLTREFLQRITQKVDDATEAIEREEDKARRAKQGGS